MSKMRITVRLDRMGNLHLDPASPRWDREFRRHLHAIGRRAMRNEALVFLQEGGPAEEFLSTLTPRQRDPIERGYTSTVMIDAWTFGHMIGHDAHTVVENGGRCASN